MRERFRSGLVRRVVLAAAVLALGLVALSVTGLAKRLISPQDDLGRRPDDDKLVVHEWGTFTTIQDVDGNGLTGVNTDDEPVPEFVYRLSDDLLVSTFNTGRPQLGRDELRRLFAKGIPRFVTPMITMRLETPVIYFHPPVAQREPLTLDVEVGFRGGWLSEYYPNADVAAPGLGPMQLTPETLSTLTWNDLRIGTDVKGPETEEAVWLEPRDVQAADVTAPNGESERFLFYRGVGRFEAPLRVATDVETNTLTLHGRFDDVPGLTVEAQIPRLWLIEVLDDGRVAYRIQGALPTAGGDKPLAKLSAKFEDADFHQANFASLRRDMHAALVEDGLYADEADAMLDTWRQAYFQSPGLRLFFLVPQAWTDHRLPLSISQPAKIDRVMMARIELISARQRRLVGEIAEAEVIDASWVDKIPESKGRNRFLAGDDDFGPLDVEIPADYQAYLDLGRFRNAILLAEEKRRPSETVTSFNNAYGLRTMQNPLQPLLQSVTPPQ